MKPSVAFVLIVALIGCGPYMQWQVRSETVYRSRTPCLQGPIEWPILAEGAKYGEKLEVYVIAKNTQAWDWQLRGKEIVDKGHEGYKPDNKRCVLTPEETATSGVAPVPVGRIEPAPPGRPALEKPPTETPIPELEEMPEARVHVDLTPDPGVQRMKITAHIGWEFDDPRHPFLIMKGSKLWFKLWADEPNDVRDALIVVRHLVRLPSVSEQEWALYHERRQAGEKLREAREAEERARKDRKRDQHCDAHHESVDCWGPGGYEGAVRRMREPPPAPPPAVAFGPPPPPEYPNSPPPPPLREYRPPPPVEGSEWIPGYFKFSKGAFAWIAGRWRLPAARSTQADPPAAPAPRPEVPPPTPTEDASWYGGHWDWNGTIYIWVPGVWLRMKR